MLDQYQKREMRNQTVSIRAERRAISAQRAAHEAVNDWREGVEPETALKRLSAALREQEDR